MNSTPAFSIRTPRALLNGPLTQPLNCTHVRDPDLKILAVLDALRKRVGAQMEVEIIGLAGFVFAATALGALLYERRMDVLYGSYIEGRKGRHQACAEHDCARRSCLWGILCWRRSEASHLCQRIVFEPYSRESFAQSFDWIAEHGISNLKAWAPAITTRRWCRSAREEAP
jgi:hypothetical protein